MRAVLALLLCGGCGVPPLKLVFTINTDGDQRCPSTNCLDVPLGCDSVISIRILDPARPSAPYLSQCQPVLRGSHMDLCSLVTELTLDQSSPIPNQTMEVQVVVYPATEIGTDPTTGKLVCPTEKEGLDFSATGFPSGSISMLDPSNGTKVLMPIAAVGGRQYWHPGDDEVDVALGCNDLAAVNPPTCEGQGELDAKGTVSDFDTNLPVTAPATVNSLTVRMGEPSHVSGGVDTEFELPAANTTVLAKVADNPPAWGANVDLTFQSTACLEVLEDVSQSTATLTCKPIDPNPTSIDITGFRLARASLDKILIGLYGSATVPAHGLTIGIVYDNNLGAKNHTITTVPSGVPIEYLDVDRMTPIPGATQTSASGMFVVRTDPADPTSGAKYGTVFSTADNNPGSVQAMGGNVDGKITLVVLALSPLVHQ